MIVIHDDDDDDDDDDDNDGDDDDDVCALMTTTMTMTMTMTTTTTATMPTEAKNLHFVLEQAETKSAKTLYHVTLRCCKSHFWANSES